MKFSELFQRKTVDTKAQTGNLDKKALSAPLGLVLNTSDNINITSNYFALSRYGYAMNPIVRRCVDRLAVSQSSIPLKLFQKPQGENKKATEIKNHPALLLMQNPNPLQSYNEFSRDFFTDYWIGGEAFIFAVINERTNQPTELWIIKPHEINVQYDSKANAIVYNIPSKGATITARSDDDFKCEIFHLKMPNPLNKFRGLSPMISAAFPIESVNDSLRWNKNLIKNGANPNGAFSTEQELNNDQFDRLQGQIEQNFVGAENAGRPLLLEAGLKYQALSMSPKDMDFINSLKQNSRMICTVYGTPPQLVGVEGESTFSNYGEALVAYWQDTVLPEEDLFIEALNIWLFDYYKEETLYFQKDVSQVFALEGKKEQLYKRVVEAVGGTIISPNEGREQIGLDDAEGGDILITNTGKIPLEMIGEDLIAQAEQDYISAVDEVRPAKPKPEDEEGEDESTGNEGEDSSEQ